MTPEIPVATERDVLITRVFAAPRHVVWRFFTDGPRLAEWFGPVGVHVEPGMRIDDVVIRLWFHDHGDRTRLTLHQGPFEPDFRDRTAEGWELSFAKLDERMAA